MVMQICYACNESFEYPALKSIDGWVTEICPNCGSHDISNFNLLGSIVKIEMKDGTTKQGRIVRMVVGAFTLQIYNKLYTFRYDYLIKMEFPGTHRESILFNEDND